MKRLLVGLLLVGVVGCGSSPGPEPPPVETDADRAMREFNNGVPTRYQGQYDKAIAACNEAIRIKPDDAKAYFNRGMAYLKKGDTAKAEADFTKVNELGYKP